MKAVGVVVVTILGIAVIVAVISLFVRVPGGLGSYGSLGVGYKRRLLELERVLL